MTKQEALGLSIGDKIIVVNTDWLSDRTEPCSPAIKNETFDFSNGIHVEKVWEDGWIKAKEFNFNHPPIRFKKTSA